MNLPEKRRDLLKRYGLALALACVALLVRYLLPSAKHHRYHFDLALSSRCTADAGPLFASHLLLGVLLAPPSRGFVRLSAEYELGFAICSRCGSSSPIHAPGGASSARSRTSIGVSVSWPDHP